MLSGCIVGTIAAARADTFQLSHGGRIEGEWLNRQEQPHAEYALRTARGVTLRLAAKEVHDTVRESPAEIEYRRRAPLAGKSAAEQWALAEWCRQQGLSAARQTHLRQVIELDPSHQQARYALGYQFLRGEWITRDESFRRDGYEFYRGKWRTPQEIEILESRGRTDVAEKDWLVRLRRWRADLNTDKAKVAEQSILSIRDPAAVRPLAQMFSQERVRSVKRLYADVLAQMNTAPSVQVLIDRTLGDSDDEIFYYCLDRVAELRPPGITEAFVPSLQDASNLKVNRAAAVLAKLGDQTSISPLIEALITTHRQVIPGRGSNATTTTFSDSGSFAKSGDGPQVIIAHIQNQSVLSALSSLTGVDFGYDQRAWRYWHAQDKIAREMKQTAASSARN